MKRPFNQLACDVCEALGLDPSRTLDIILVMRVDSFPVAFVKTLIIKDGKLSTVLKKYELSITPKENREISQ